MQDLVLDGGYEGLQLLLFGGDAAGAEVGVARDRPARAAQVWSAKGDISIRQQRVKYVFTLNPQT